MKRQSALFFVCSIVVTLLISDVPAQPTRSQEGQMKFTEHPGTIKMIDAFDGSIRTKKAEDAPDAQRFVYLDATGAEIRSTDQAAERIPIVEVQMIPTDGEGKLVSKEGASTIRILEYGPNKRLLRSTVMARSAPRK
jgi:hypothetical protein